jgi:uncharacterized membrane protein YtjA (UPF0391 family)
MNVEGYRLAELLCLALVFFAIALILGVLGVRGAGISMDIAKWLIIVFVILAVLTLIFGSSLSLLVMPLAL